MTHDPMKKNGASGPSVSRRRLVRAAGLAGPAVITLRSGQAWALSNCASTGQTYMQPSQSSTGNVSTHVEMGSDGTYELFGQGSVYEPGPGQVDSGLNVGSLSYSC